MLFVLAFDIATDRTVRTGYFLPKVQIKDYNIMIDGRNFFDQPIKNLITIQGNIRKNVVGQGNDYKSGIVFNFTEKLLD